MAEVGEIPPQRVLSVNLAVENPPFLTSEIRIPQEQLGVEKWDEMLRQSQEQNIEKGIVISSRRGKVISTGIIDGVEDHFTPPSLPHGLISLLPGEKDLVLVHTHLIPDYLATTVVSRKDIQAFIDSRYKASVIIDGKGGIHMLMGKWITTEFEEVDIKKALKNPYQNRAGKTAFELMTDYARIIGNFGVKYYFGWQKNAVRDGFVNLKDILYFPPSPQTTAK